MTRKTKRLLHCAGSALVIVSLLFVAQRLWLYAGQIDFSSCSLSWWVSMGGVCVVCCAFNLCLPRLWSACLRIQGVRLPPGNVMKIYGYSQIGKYLPGNIAHLAGRQALTMAENLPAKVVATSILCEFLLLSICATGIFLPQAVMLLLAPESPPGLAVCLFFLCVAAILLYGGRLFGTAARAGLYWALGYLCGMGAVWVACLTTVTKQEIDTGWLAASAAWYVIAWLVGFLTPGAPAGLGMREAAILLLAKNAPIPEADLLLATLCCRGISVLGDVGFFLLAMIERMKKQDNVQSVGR